MLLADILAEIQISGALNNIVVRLSERYVKSKPIPQIIWNNFYLLSVNEALK